MRSIERGRRRVPVLAGLVAALLLPLLLPAAAHAVPAAPTAPRAAAVVGPALPGGAWSNPAVVRLCSNCADDMVVVRTNDNRLFYSTGAFFNSPTDENFTYHGWREIPGNGRTPYPPSITRLGDFIYVAVTGLNGNGIFLQRFNWKTSAWDAGWGMLPGGGRFIAGPAVAAYAGQILWFFAPGLDGHVFHQFWTNAYGWSGSWTPHLDLRTTTAVAAVEHRSVVWVFARGNDRRIYLSRFSVVGNDSSWTEVPGGGLTDHSPAVTANEPGFGSHDRLLLAVRGTGDGIAYQKLENDAWNPGWNWLPYAGSTPYAPTVLAAGDFVKAWATSGDHAVYVQHLKYNYADGRTLIAATSSLPAWLRVPLTLPQGPTPPLPTVDLAFTGPPQYDPGSKRIYITLKNTGTKAAGAFQVGALIDNGSIGNLPVSSLGAGQTYTMSFSVAGFPAGTYSYNFVLDVYGTVAETNENNNSWNGYFSV